jgi:hypothetical protein
VHPRIGLDEPTRTLGNTRNRRHFQSGQSHERVGFQSLTRTQDQVPVFNPLRNGSGLEDDPALGKARTHQLRDRGSKYAEGLRLVGDDHDLDSGQLAHVALRRGQKRKFVGGDRPADALRNDERQALGTSPP